MRTFLVRFMGLLIIVVTVVVAYRCFGPLVAWSAETLFAPGVDCDFGGINHDTSRCANNDIAAGMLSVLGAGFDFLVPMIVGISMLFCESEGHRKSRLLPLVRQLVASTDVRAMTQEVRLPDAVIYASDDSKWVLKTYQEWLRGQGMYMVATESVWKKRVNRRTATRN